MSVKWQTSSPQKHRLRWTGELEQFFNDAVDKLGGVNVATPQAVVDILKKKYPQITTSHVKSHLQHIRNKKQALSKRKLQIPDQFYIKTEDRDIESEAGVVLEGNSESDKDNDRLLHHHYYANVRNDNFFNKDKLKLQGQRKLFFKEYFENKYQQQASFRKKFIYDQLQVCQNVDANDHLQIEGLKQCVQQIIDDFQQCVPAISQDPIFEKYQESLLNIQPHHPLKQEIQELTKMFVFCHAHIFKDMLKEGWRSFNKDGDIFNEGEIDPYFQPLQYFEQYQQMGPPHNCAADLITSSDNHKPIFKRNFSNSLCDTDTQNQYRTPRKGMFNMLLDATNSMRCDAPTPTPSPAPASTPTPNPTSSAVPDSSYDMDSEFQQMVVDEVQNKTLQQSIFQKFLKEQQNQESNNFKVEGGTESNEKESNGFVFSKVVKSKDSMYCFNSTNGNSYFGQQDTHKNVSKHSSDLTSNKRLKFSNSNCEFEEGGRISLNGRLLQNNLKICEMQDSKFEQLQQQQQQQQQVMSSDSVSKFQCSNGDSVRKWNRLQAIQIENPPKFAGFSLNPEEDMNRCVQT